MEQYVVIKRDVWKALLDILGQSACPDTYVAALAAPLAVETAVICQDDPFAVATLHSYAANVRTAIEFTEATGLSVMTDEQHDALMDKADGMVEIACRWQAMTHHPAQG